MIYVCWADISAVGESADGLLLSAYRREKLQTIRLPELRKQSIGAELLLLHALRNRCPELTLPPRIVCDAGGKPRFEDTALYFNLSHSAAYAACALSDHPVGVDIQTNTPAREKLAGRCFTPEERSYFSRSEDRDAAFTELWCRKESYIKATGEGLSTGLLSFCAAPGAEHMMHEGVCFTTVHHALPNFHLAVCFPKDQKDEIVIEKIELP